MARLSSANPPAASDPTAINLTRLLIRLQQNINSPDPDVESKLRTSSLERTRVGHNIEYARNLLLKLEQEALNIKVQSKKVDTQTGLVKKRETLERLSERLDELNEFADPDELSSEGEDLGEDTPSDTEDEQASLIDASTQSIQSSGLTREQPLPQPTSQSTMEPKEEEPTSTLRQRKTAREERDELLAPSSTTGISTSTETLITHNRAEQEAITASLLSMASALKESSKSFSHSLETEKSVLDRTVEGLDRNELGLDAASRRMGHLRSLTEGKGWLGRMLLYAYIAGLAVVAILLVFVIPKFRIMDHDWRLVAKKKKV